MPKPSDQTSSAEDSPAKTLATPASEPVWLGNVPAFGGSMQGSFVSYDPDSSSWRTFQLCLGGASETYSETWPRAGTMRSGTAFQRQPSAPITAVIASSSLPTPTASAAGYNQGGAAGRVGPIRPSLRMMARQNLWPTPTAADGKGVRRYARGNLALSSAVQMWPTPTVHGNYNKAGLSATSGDGLATAVAKRWATPTVQYSKNCGGPSRKTGRQVSELNAQVGGPLNPTWVEWLMGFPLGHTDLEPSETP